MAGADVKQKTTIIGQEFMIAQVMFKKMCFKDKQGL